MVNKKLFSREEGQGLVEYALILVLVAIVVIAILLLLGPALQTAYCKVANALQPGSCGALSIVSGPTPSSVLGNYRLDVTVSVAQTTAVTFSGGGKSATASCAANTNCSISLSGVTASGSYTVSGGGATLTGTY